MSRCSIRIGLTGSIGMGKSAAAAALRRLGVPVFDADAAVHALMRGRGRAVAPIEAAFPGVVEAGAVVRPRLRGVVLGAPAELERLERIVHPLVRQEEAAFRRRAARGRARVLAFDIPLLFETGGARRYDATLVVSAPSFVQSARVLARPGLTRVELARILSRQMPDGEKRRRADFVVPTGGGRREALVRIARIVRLLRGPRGWAWLRAKGRGRRRFARA